MPVDYTLQRLSYTAFMAIALIAFVLVRRWQPQWARASQPLTFEQRFALNMAAFIGGMIAAKLPFLFSDASEWFGGQAWLADGKTVTTGLAGAYVSVEITKLVLGITAKTGDAYALPLAIALAIGRWGCFFNGCCYGIHTSLPWGVDFLGDGPRHPTQIYEVIFHATMACVLLQLARKDVLRLQRLKLYLIAYCVFRFFTEFIRPEPPLAFGLTFYQWFTAAFALGLAIQWSRDSTR